jgi:hypothetical protein
MCSIGRILEPRIGRLIMDVWSFAFQRLGNFIYTTEIENQWEVSHEWTGRTGLTRVIAGLRQKRSESNVRANVWYAHTHKHHDNADSIACIWSAVGSVYISPTAPNSTKIYLKRKTNQTDRRDIQGQECHFSGAFLRWLFTLCTTTHNALLPKVALCA